MPEQSKSLFKSKTFWANIALAAAPYLLESVGQRVPLDTPQAAILIGAANIFLRTYTDKPVHVLPADAEK